MQERLQNDLKIAKDKCIELYKKKEEIIQKLRKCGEEKEQAKEEVEEKAKEEAEVESYNQLKEMFEQYKKYIPVVKDKL